MFKQPITGNVTGKMWNHSLCRTLQKQTLFSRDYLEFNKVLKCMPTEIEKEASAGRHVFK
jgi:hypothetical protein